MAYLIGQSSTEQSVTMLSAAPSTMDTMTEVDMRPRAMGVILSIASCLIISTNVVVAAALLKLLLKKSSQSWCFVLNLALADALVGVAITGLAVEDFTNHPIAPDLNTNATPPAAHGKSRCLMRMAFVISPCTASIMSMFLISLDRYAAIKIPLRYSLLSRKGTAFGSLLALWISAATIGFLPVMVRQLQADKHYDGLCAFFSVIQEVGIIILFSVCFFPLLSVFIYIYLDILKIACGHQKQISRVRQVSCRTPDNHTHQHFQNNGQHQHLRSWYWSHVKALRTVAVLVGCFLMLWCPFFVVCIVHIVCTNCGLKRILESYLFLLGLCNSLINPLVYAFWQREVRQQLVAMFSCITGRSPAAGPPGVIERCGPLPPVQTQTCVSGGDILSPTLLQPVTHEAHLPLSATSSL